MLYNVRLDAPDSPQFRQRTFDAPNATVAQRMAEQCELNRVNFSLHTPRLAPITRHAGGTTARHDRLAQHGIDHTVQGGDILNLLHRDHALEGGKVLGPNKYFREYLSMHHQAEPFKVASVEPVSDRALMLAQLQQLEADPTEWNRLFEQLRADGVPVGVVTATLFGLTAQKMIDGSGPIVWTTATIKTSLHTVTYVPNQDTHQFFSSATNEVTGTGYAAGGTTLSSATTTYDATTDQVRLDAADASWAASTITARIGVVYNDTAGASTTDPMLGWVDFGADVTTSAGTFQITWDATGIVVYDVT